ncbi:MAG: NAD(+) diphosphatase [Pseudomonadota bacterium]
MRRFIAIAVGRFHILSMPILDNPNWFAASPLTRPNQEKDLSQDYREALANPDSILIPLWRGDPLVVDGRAGFLSVAARDAFPKDAPTAFLGYSNGRAHFAVDASGISDTPESAPFAEIGEYVSLRAAAGNLDRYDLAIIGHARWLFEWRRKNRFCANCGSPVRFDKSGAKSVCNTCETAHFPRTEPVAIVLVLHGDACLLGRGANFPPGFMSALAGFVEAAETPEEAAKREIFEEAGVRLSDIQYQFSQPWPFPASLMMGFFATAEERALVLDTTEIVEARWFEHGQISAMLDGETTDIFLPPPFTIAHQLLRRWIERR